MEEKKVKKSTAAKGKKTEEEELVTGQVDFLEDAFADDPFATKKEQKKEGNIVHIHYQ